MREPAIRRAIAPLRLLLWAPVLLLCAAQSAQGQPPIGPPSDATAAVPRDSLLAFGERQLRADELNEAIETFARLVELHPEDAYLLTRLGTAYARKGEFEEAEERFKAAKKLDENLAAAYVGLGLVYAERPAKGLSAYYNFRRAVGEAKRATKIDPSYGPAYRLLGEAYERFQDDHEKALRYYAKYIELEPDNPDGLYYFGLACVQARQFDKVDAHITPYLQAHPKEIQLIPIAAQGYFFQERYEPAQEYFERYLYHLDGRERQLYTDITHVASELELQEYEATSGAERLAYLERFWARRDPDILTKINERIIEHYRRIWYARTFLSENAYPWDKRGEIYIRYGEPDYRSRSDQRQFVQSPEAEAVRTRMAIEIYGPEAAFLTFTGPVFPVRTYQTYRLNMNDPERIESVEEGNELDPADQIDSSEEGLDPPDDLGGNDAPDDDYDGKIDVLLQFGNYAPVTIDNEIDTVPWETWTYTQILGGMEITFTDETSNGSFDFAPLPAATFENEDALTRLARMTRYAPEIMVQNAISESPDYYRPGLLGPALSFYYDVADFRGSDGQTALEVYYGISPGQVEIEQQADSAYIHVRCALALADRGHTTIYRTAEDFLYQGTSDIQKSKGAFVPELLKTQIPPGKYELQVQLRDLISGRTGLYKQSLEVKDYRPEGLRISDIQLASSIADTGSIEQFKKGDIWIIPMPTRAYRQKQKVHAYFEIYNLKKNEFGQTRYEAQYLVRSSDMPAVGVFGAVSSGFRSLFRSKKPQVSVTYEQTGTSASEHEYVEIDLAKAKPGVNALEVTITDLVGGEKQTREIRFRYGR